MSWFARRRDAAEQRRSRTALPVGDDVVVVPPPPPPPPQPTPVVVGEGDDGYRLLLLSSDMSDGWGVRNQREGIGGALAEALHLATGERVVVETLVDDHWEQRDPVEALLSHDIAGHHAVVVAGLYYQPGMLDPSLDTWRRTTEELRDSLLAAIGPTGFVQLLQLPWHDAITRNPQRWGGEIGERISALQQIAHDTLDGFRQIVTLRLHPPADAEEWGERGFSAQTYRAWGVEAALSLLPRLRERTPLSAPAPAVAAE